IEIDEQDARRGQRAERKKKPAHHAEDHTRGDPQECLQQADVACRTTTSPHGIFPRSVPGAAQPWPCNALQFNVFPGQTEAANSCNLLSAPHSSGPTVHASLRGMTELKIPMYGHRDGAELPFICG